MRSMGMLLDTFNKVSPHMLLVPHTYIAYAFSLSYQDCFTVLKGNSHQILLSKMNLPGIEVL